MLEPFTQGFHGNLGYRHRYSVAEQLGEASLRLTLDTKGLDEALKAAKAKIEGELGGTIEKAARKQTGQKPGGTAGGLSAELKASAKILALRNSINILETKGSNVSQFRARLSEIEAAAANRQFKSVAQQGEVLRQLVSAEQNRLQVTKNITTENEKQRRQQIKIARENAVPVSGVIKTPGLPAFQFPGSPGIRGGRPPAVGQGATSQATRSAERAAAAERKLAADRDKAARATQRAQQQEAKRRTQLTKDIAANALIGVGFPLLFGQGPGAALGGGLGGAAGALGGGTFGFAGSIAGTALGAAFDAALLKGQELAKGLDDPIKNFEALRQAALLSSKAVEKNAEALIAAGREEEAAAVIRQDLNRILGNSESLKAYTDNLDALNRAWTEASVLVVSFTAGPLANFLKKLREGLEATVQLTPDERTRLRRQATNVVEQQTTPLQRTGFAGGVNVNLNGQQFTGTAKGVLEDITAELERQAVEAKKTAAAQQSQAQTAEVIAGAAERTRQVNQLNLDIIEASARGNRVQALELERRLAVLQQTRRLNALPQNADPVLAETIRTETAEKLRGIDEKRAALQQEINRELFTEQQTRNRLERSISNTQTLIAAQPGLYRDMLRSIQQITTSIEEARTKEAELGFQIGQARIGGREEEAAQLVRQQQIAAIETRAKLVEGALALKEAGESLRDNLRQATLEFTRVRSDPQGLNRFLRQTDVNRRAQQDFQLLLPQFRAAQAQFQQLTGVRGPDFTGRTDVVNAQIRDFIDRVTREREATRDLVGAQQSLVQVNAQLVTVNTQLATATQALAAKDWTVNVQVNNQAGGASTVNAINGLAQ